MPEKKEKKREHAEKAGQKPNRLIDSKSPYLLQHAYNPVDWYPWGDEALGKAKTENKIIILSIGYSACHWCHVMERESFENTETAKLMNTDFISIKVDREERPDIDQIYMDAIHIMGLQGGWPLNVFLLPNTQPFYGGTYFPPDHWQYILNQIAKAFKNNREELIQSAAQFTKAIQLAEKNYFKDQKNSQVNKKTTIEKVYQQIESDFDKQDGGLSRVPKFVIPSMYNFFLTYSTLYPKSQAAFHTFFTLHKVAEGGIYDHIGGGFSRYSTDKIWLVPHFEKMLYDNAQLINLYSKAFQLTKHSDFKTVVYETIAFLKKELMSSEGGFYSALDADSEGEEGKFYVWKTEELDKFLGQDSKLFKTYFNVRDSGNWEHGKNILHVNDDLTALAEKEDLTVKDLKERLKLWKVNVSKAREKRIKPGLDNKVLASWNGLTLTALVQSYFAFNDSAFLALAEKNASFLEKNMLLNQQSLLHTYRDGSAAIDGFLEDYASVIEGYIALYQANFEEKWLYLAKSLTDYCIKNFYDESDNLFFFTPQNHNLITRKKELFDNVIPASNSIMAHNLLFLSKFFDEKKYTNILENMMTKMGKLVEKYGKDLVNWGNLYALSSQEIKEIVIIGADYKKFAQEIQGRFFPYKIVMATQKAGTLPLMQNKTTPKDKTTIYVCKNKVCKLPVFSVEEALKLMYE